MSEVKGSDIFFAQHTKEYYNDVTDGIYTDRFIVNKFGRNAAVGTTLVPICIGGNYRTPLTAQSLEILSTSVNDTALGTGARSMFIQGLDANYELQSEIVPLNGTTAVALVNTYTRVFRYGVETSGTYGTQIIGSHDGELTLQGSGGGDIWATITKIGAFGIGQSQIGVYTVPRGYKAKLLSKYLTIEANKPANLYFYKRDKIDVTTAPFSAMRVFEESDGVQVPFGITGKAPIQTFDELTDIGFMGAMVSGTGSISVDFQLEVIKK